MQLNRKEAVPIITIAPLLAACAKATQQPQPTSKEAVVKPSEKIISRAQLVQLSAGDMQNIMSAPSSELRFPLPMVLAPEGSFLVEDTLYVYEQKARRTTFRALSFRIPEGNRLTLFTAPTDGQISVSMSDMKERQAVRIRIAGKHRFDFDFYCSGYHLWPEGAIVSMGTPIAVATCSPQHGQPNDKRFIHQLRLNWYGLSDDEVKLVSEPKDAHVTLSIDEKYHFFDLPSLYPSVGNVLRIQDGRYGWYVSDNNNPETARLLQTFFASGGILGNN